MRKWLDNGLKVEVEVKVQWENLRVNLEQLRTCEMLTFMASIYAFTPCEKWGDLFGFTQISSRQDPIKSPEQTNRDLLGSSLP